MADATHNMLFENAKVTDTKSESICKNFLFKNLTNFALKELQKELKSFNSKFDLFLNESVKKQESNSPKASNNLRKNNGSPTIWSSLNMTTKSYEVSGDVAGGSKLPDRIFLKRNSLLTEMFKINHIRTIRHIFISIMIILALQVIFNELIENGK